MSGCIYLSLREVRDSQRQKRFLGCEKGVWNLVGKETLSLGYFINPPYNSVAPTWYFHWDSTSNWRVCLDHLMLTAETLGLGHVFTLGRRSHTTPSSMLCVQSWSPSQLTFITHPFRVLPLVVFCFRLFPVFAGKVHFVTIKQFSVFFKYQIK